MRVISGIAKGKSLIAPEGMHTRPITDRIKESLFDSWQFSIPGCDFLDLFSGSGSMGIEALSREANKVVMVDNDNQAIRVIKTNITNCHLNKLNYKVLKDDVFNVIKDMGNRNETFDIIYADPPFTVDSIFHPLMEALGNGLLLKEDGIIAIRTLSEKKMNDSYDKLEKFKEKKYGLSTMHFYRIKSENS